MKGEAAGNDVEFAVVEREHLQIAQMPIDVAEASFTPQGARLIDFMGAVASRPEARVSHAARRLSPPSPARKRRRAKGHRAWALPHRP